MATKRKSKPKPITFFGHELKHTNNTDPCLCVAGALTLTVFSPVWRDSNNHMACVDSFNGRDLTCAHRKSPRAAVAAAERETLKLLGKLVAATGHKLVVVRKGKGK